MDIARGKTALITGGSGIVGSGIIASFLRAGCRVVAPCRSKEAVQSLKEAVGPGHDDALLVSLSDVSDEYACSDLADVIKTKYGTLDYVVSCIGAFPAPGDALPAHLPTLLSKLTTSCLAYHIVFSTMQHS
jgi:NAD(P)-dependent dehydrogenase (short-subunit alcohol dehydrogenase family)